VLAAFRKNRGITVAAVARKDGITVSQVNAIEEGNADYFGDMLRQMDDTPHP
jgi:transcriptional regulator with XRE-family HTH domain